MSANAAANTFSSAHRLYVKSLYRRYLKNALDWTVRRDLWRPQALQIRAEFERNRNVSDPRSLAIILERAEADLAKSKHPDPYIAPTAPGGTKWERNTPHCARVRPRSTWSLELENHMTVFPKYMIKSPQPRYSAVLSMNYLRGAVNAISVPYQYYKDLNPSTLTGAIDVIVIQRPAPNGGTELVCSPFHVRFGKWQVLRPFEKKVQIFVNGNSIPFDMKIGEAGEAFFVFETEDDVPPDLITSPILQPTIPEDEHGKEPVHADKFGAKEDEGEGIKLEGQRTEEPSSVEPVEPDFLDLDGGPKPHEEDIPDDIKSTPTQSYFVPQSLRKSGSKATISLKTLGALPSPPPSREHSRERSRGLTMDEQDQRADALLKYRGQIHTPEVEYHQDVTLDMEGYKQGYHDRERSDQTVRSSQAVPFPPSSQASSFTHTQSAVQSPYEPSPSTSRSPSPSDSDSSQPTHHYAHSRTFRATSEPPPDLESHSDPHVDPVPPPMPHPGPLKLQVPLTQEYSWEWGGFPTPSPMKPTFGKGGRIERVESAGKGKKKAMWGPADMLEEEEGEDADDDERVGRSTSKVARFQGHSTGEVADDRPPLSARVPSFVGRSRSVPPQLEATLDSPLKRRDYKEYEDAGVSWSEDDEEHPIHEFRDRESLLQDDKDISKFLFGEDGILSPSDKDPNVFVLCVGGRKISFQLSLVPREGEDPTNASGSDDGAAERLFNKYLVSVARFVDDDSVVTDPRLVLRWENNEYLTRSSGPSLHDALERWRKSTLKNRVEGETLRAVSPPPEYIPEPSSSRQDQDQRHSHSSSEPPTQADKAKAEEEDKKDQQYEQGQNETTRKPATSLSWVQWWSRSRRRESGGKGDVSTNGQHPLDVVQDASSTSLPLPAQQPQPGVKAKDHADTVPSTPTQRPADIETTPTKPSVDHRPPQVKKYAKTLRLTSDQLKSLNLRPGANSITFSLSATGAIAATARIFVWDHTDLVVISDIDGTITKSDGLGHVFAMIGRDWTHMGVAKLYTDIVRNGYKIMYLTSRAIGQADSTRYYLKGIKQNNYQLPEGPVVMSPDRLMASLHREVIMRKPEVFKMACLRDIQRLFGESARNPFYAGFGNRITDALSYRSVNVPSARIFTIDSSGEVKMELLELAGYKSSYIHMTDLVDQMFPPIHKKWTPEFTDFNYWKAPVQDFPLPDLSPPSPALSARSDTSNQSALARLRNFSLGGGAANNGRPLPSKQSSMSSVTNGDVQQSDDEDEYRSSHLRQMSSFERLSSTLGFMTRPNANGDNSRRSVSPDSSTRSSYASDSEDEDGVGVDGRPRRQRRRSMTSMPGTLDEMHFGMDDSDDEADHHGDGSGEEEEGEEGDPLEDEDPQFEDDIMAAVEMKDVPYI